MYREINEVFIRKLFKISRQENCDKLTNANDNTNIKIVNRQTDSLLTDYKLIQMWQQDS